MMKRLTTYKLILAPKRIEADICKGMPVTVTILIKIDVLSGRLKISVLRRCLLLWIR